MEKCLIVSSSIFFPLVSTDVFNFLKYSPYFKNNFNFPSIKGTVIFQEITDLPGTASCSSSKENVYCLLIHFRPMLHFFTLSKRQKTSGFLTFSGSIEIERGLEKYQFRSNLYDVLKKLFSKFVRKLRKSLMKFIFSYVAGLEHDQDKWKGSNFGAFPVNTYRKLRVNKYFTWVF